MQWDWLSACNTLKSCTCWYFCLQVFNLKDLTSYGMPKILITHSNLLLDMNSSDCQLFCLLFIKFSKLLSKHDTWFWKKFYDAFPAKIYPQFTFLILINSMRVRQWGSILQKLLNLQFSIKSVSYFFSNLTIVRLKITNHWCWYSEMFTHAYFLCFIRYIMMSWHRYAFWAPSQYKDRLIYVWWFPC